MEFGKNFQLMEIVRAQTLERSKRFAVCGLWPECLTDLGL